jgi:hypothetical protein
MPEAAPVLLFLHSVPSNRNREKWVFANSTGNKGANSLHYRVVAERERFEPSVKVR